MLSGDLMCMHCMAAWLQDGGEGKVGILQHAAPSGSSWWEVKWIEKGSTNSYR